MLPTVKSTLRLGVLVALLAVGTLACRRDPPEVSFSDRTLERVSSFSPLPSPPPDSTNRVADDDAAAHFGRFLFFDERLSGNGEVSCASCHRPNHGFSVPTRLGHGIGETPRHPPSLLDVAQHRWFDWDGKADSLWLQALRPLEKPNEHGTTRTAVARLVANTDELERAYEAVFEESLPSMADESRFPPAARPRPDAPESEAHRTWRSMAKEDRKLVNRVASDVTKAIAAYERRLQTGDAPFDRFVRGVAEEEPELRRAMSPSAKRGLKLFVGKAGCARCHNGPNFTDETFHNLGLPDRPWLKDRDLGRWRGVEQVRESPFNATGPYSDAREGKGAKRIQFLKRTPEGRGQFKTPSLRNVARTPPYMHGGHFDTLEEVVRFYSTLAGTVDVGHREEMLDPLGLTDREIDDLVAFLEALSGERPPEKLLRPPDSPVPPSAGEGEE